MCSNGFIIDDVYVFKNETNKIYNSLLNMAVYINNVEVFRDATYKKELCQLYRNGQYI